MYNNNKINITGYIPTLHGTKTNELSEKLGFEDNIVDIINIIFENGINNIITKNIIVNKLNTPLYFVYDFMFDDFINNIVTKLNNNTNLTKSDIMNFVINEIIGISLQIEISVSDIIIKILDNFKNLINNETYKLIGNIKNIFWYYDIQKILNYLDTPSLPKVGNNILNADYLLNILVDRPLLALPVYELYKNGNITKQFMINILNKLLEYINKYDTFIEDNKYEIYKYSLYEWATTVPEGFDKIIINVNDIKAQVYEYIKNIRKMSINEDSIKLPTISGEESFSLDELNYEKYGSDIVNNAIIPLFNHMNINGLNAVEHINENSDLINDFLNSISLSNIDVNNMNDNNISEILHIIIDELIPEPENNKISYIDDLSLHKNIIDIFKHYKSYIKDKTYMLIKNIYNKFWYYDIKKIFEYMLSVDGLPNIVFDIVKSRPILALILSEITMIDTEYNKYNIIFLNTLLEYDDNHIKDNLDKIMRYHTIEDYVINNVSEYDAVIIDTNNIKEQVNYMLTQIRLQKINLNDDDISYILKHLLDSGDYKDSKLLRSRLFTKYYLNLPLTTSSTDLSLDSDSIINIINKLKK